MPRTFRLLIALLVLGFGAGCAAFGSGENTDNERMLSAAGFQMRLADTPDKLAQIQALKQRTVIPQEHQGRPIFIYADAKGCKCLFAGTERAYRRYEQMAFARGMAIRRQETAEARSEAAMNLTQFGPWGPWWW